MNRIAIVIALTMFSTNLAFANSGGKAMDCAECAEAYCGGNKSCKECKPLCAPKRRGDSGGASYQRTADEDAGEFGTEEEVLE